MAYKITIKPSDHEFQITANDTILEAALNHGCMLPYSCRTGSCGSCIGNIVSGTVQYADSLPPGISAAEQAEGKALLCQAHAKSDLVIEAREIKAIQDIEIKTLPCRVSGMKKLAHDVMQLTLKLPANERLQFLAGQYIDLIMRNGRRRSFSLANPPHAADLLELHVRHVPGGAFSDFVFQRMREKAILRFQGPLGCFFLNQDSDRPIILMGGGTGFAPLKSILEQAFHKGIQRPIHLYWGVRDHQDLYMHELPTTWEQRFGQFSYTPVLSNAKPTTDWQGRTGLVHEAVLADYPDLSAYELYMSGPPPMIEAGKAAFKKHGLPEQHLFYDSFEFASDSQTKF